MVERNGYTLYVRDNSFLGFPAYHLFVPGLSEVDAKLYDVVADLKANNEGFFKVKPEYRLQVLSKEEKETFVEKNKVVTTPEITLFPYNASLYNRFNRQLLLALMAYSLGRDKEAYYHMSIFLDEKANDGNRQIPYYYCVRDMFNAKSICDDTDSIVTMLSTIYTADLVKEVLADMADRVNVLKNFPLPVCFRCEVCRIKNCCSYSTIVDVERKIQERQIRNLINQEYLKQIFD